MPEGLSAHLGCEGDIRESQVGILVQVIGKLLCDQNRSAVSVFADKRDQLEGADSFPVENRFRAASSSTDVGSIGCRSIPSDVTAGVVVVDYFVRLPVGERPVDIKRRILEINLRIRSLEVKTAGQLSMPECCGTVLMSPATPAAVSRCPTFVFSDPMQRSSRYAIRRLAEGLRQTP